MLKIAQLNDLVVTEFRKGGCFLAAGEIRVYLPKKEVPAGTRVGDTLQVFVYNDSRTTLKATTMTPLAAAGDYAALEVKTVTEFGVFLEWGIPKDLFVPLRCQSEPLQVGEVVVVRLVEEEDGVIGTCMFHSLLEPAGTELAINREVSLLIYQHSRIGWLAVVDNRHPGIVYHSEVFQDLRVGDRLTGYIKKVRTDGRIDAALQRQGFRAAAGDAREVVLQALQAAGGFLPLHDGSSPAEIKKYLNLSKKVFKKTIGGLYRERRISLEPGGIRAVPAAGR